MDAERGKKLILTIGVVLFLWFAWYAYSSDVKAYIADSFVFIGILVGFYFLYGHLRMTPFSYSVLVLACALHNAGVFGWYNVSPLPYLDPLWQQHISAHPFQWDHITHVVGIFAITLVLFQYMSQYLKKRKLHKLPLLVIVILAGMGSGAVIEHYEFFGFLTVGEGEGGLGKGGAGDYTGDWASSDWLNLQWDLMYNALGAVLAVLFGYIKHRKQN